MGARSPNGLEAQRRAACGHGGVAAVIAPGGQDPKALLQRLSKDEAPDSGQDDGAAAASDDEAPGNGTKGVLMHKTLFFLLFALSVWANSARADERGLAVTRTDAAATDKRIALVIGNSAYANSPLKNPVNDARDMASKLRSLGFDVVERSNLQTRQIGSTLSEFRSRLSPGAVALVFYAGHGLQISGENYLPAVDAEINAEEDVQNQSLSVRQIMDVLDKAKTRLNLVFLDACRNNPYARSFRSADNGLARISAPSGTLISYATRPGSVAQDGSGHNGLYTSKLLEQMDSNRQIEQALKRVVTEVKAASQGKQEPWMEGSIEGDFCFKGCSVASLEPVPVPVSVPVHIKTKDEIEQESWDSAKDSNNIDAVKEYLKQYPHGRFAGQAKILIATLKKAPAPAPVPAPESEARPVAINVTLPPVPVAPKLSSSANDAEGMTWAEAVKGNTVEDYKLYLDSYPQGKYAKQAAEQKQKLEAYAKASAEAAAAQKEDAAWNTAQQGNSEASYNDYLRQYATGRYAALAKMKIKKARQAEEEKAKAAAEAFLSQGPAMVAIPGRNFEIGKYLVTQGEWKAVMGNNPSHFQNCGDNCPVEQVNWDDVQTFLQKLNAKTGRQYRLPTEEEWEVACYGGIKTDYCGSNDIDAVAWYGNQSDPGGNSGHTTHPVGQKQANGYGLYDMSGNVWEWMANLLVSNHPEQGRALRGGSWINGPLYARAANRSDFFIYFPSTRRDDFGFRLARTLP